MYIKDDLNYIIQDDISINNDRKFESIFVDFHSNNILGEIYRNPDSSESSSLSYDKKQQT